MTQYSQRSRKKRSIYDPNAPQSSFPEVDELLNETDVGTIRGKKADKQKGYLLKLNN